MSSATNLKIAFVHLTSRRKQTVVAVLSVVFGVGTYVFMNGFMTGVNDAQTDLAFSTLAHVRICNDMTRAREPRTPTLAANDALHVVHGVRSTPFTEGIRNSAGVIKTVSLVPGITAIAPQVNMPVGFHRGATRIDGLLSGVDPTLENQVFGTAQYVESGRWEELDHRSDGIVLGKTLAANLGVGTGDRIQVRTVGAQNRTFQVVGILEVGITSVDAQKGFVPIRTARRMLAANASYVTDLQVGLEDFDAAREVAREIAALVPYPVDPWQDANGQLEVGNSLRRIIALAVSLSLLIVAGFGIYNIMNMTVNEKMRQIAILMAMGFDRHDIVLIFLVQSLAIGLLGGSVGLLFGFAGSMALDQAPFQIATLDTYPMTYRTVDYVASFLSGLVTTFIAGFLPSWRAAQIDPVQIIRG